MSRWNYALIVGSALAATLACGRTPRSDALIAQDVRNELQQAGDVGADSITVQAVNGDVTLQGSVPSEASKRRAEDIAEDVRGVKHVANELRVVASPPLAAPPVSAPPPASEAPSPGGPGPAPSPSTMP